MNASAFCKYSIVIGCLLGGHVGYSQTATTPATANSRVEQLKAQDPATFVSERGYEKQWTTLNEKDITWKKRLWRILDTRAKGNESLNALAKGGSLATVLVNGFLEGKYKAYSKADDRFSTELTKEAYIAQLPATPKDPTTGFDVGQITKFAIKEDWLYMPTENKFIVRIIGIAPLKETVVNGVVKEEPLLWIYYPGARNYLAEQKIAGNNKAETLDQLIDTHEFVSSIEKAEARTPVTHAGGYRW